MHEMPLDRVTEREGHWYLRQGRLNDSDELWVAVVSNRAPEGTTARDLRPETLEVLYDGDEDHITLPVDALRELLAWPPSPRRWRVYCSQFAACKWSGYRQASSRGEATAKPCPQCGKRVTS